MEEHAQNESRASGTGVDLEALRAQRAPGVEGEAARGVAPSNKRYMILTHASGPACAHYPLPWPACWRPTLRTLPAAACKPPAG